jgi:hypothetical protein
MRYVRRGEGSEGLSRCIPTLDKEAMILDISLEVSRMEYLEYWNSSLRLPPILRSRLSLALQRLDFKYNKALNPEFDHLVQSLFYATLSISSITERPLMCSDGHSPRMLEEVQRQTAPYDDGKVLRGVFHTDCRHSSTMDTVRKYDTDHTSHLQIISIMPYLMSRLWSQQRERCSRYS